jgi:5-methyltetrahydrofolate--homocysteine methyltransferase
MKRITEQIAEGQILVSDGAWGTFLQKKGLKAGECPELWCLTRRPEVLAIARAYLQAGADLIKTNSFGGSIFKLEFYGLADKAAEINQAAAAISREAAGTEKHVIASIGPTGKMLLMGDVTEDQLLAAFAAQAMALEKGGADAALIETMSDISEACLAIRAVRKNTKLEIICTFTFEKNVSGEYRTMMGVSPVDMAKACVEAGAHIIGANCGNGFEQMPAIAAEIRRVNSRIPVIVHANAGLPINRNGVTFFPETPAMAAKFVPDLIRAGANIIGGCCGTTPEHIKAIAAAVRTAKR